mgnify:CR=1 FL=1
MLDRVAATAARLSDEFAIGHGDRVGILAANRPEWVITFFATFPDGASEDTVRAATEGNGIPLVRCGTADDPAERLAAAMARRARRPMRRRG